MKVEVAYVLDMHWTRSLVGPRNSLDALGGGILNLLGSHPASSVASYTMYQNVVVPLSKFTQT
jgi:hypothetical protein